MGEKWYNSGFFSYVGEGIGIGLAFLGLCYGLKGCTEPPGPTFNEVKIKEIEAKLAIQPSDTDLNKDGRKEEFVEIDGRLYFQVIDGENLEDRVLKR